jgi:hypothetical protein
LGFHQASALIKSVHFSTTIIMWLFPFLSATATARKLLVLLDEWRFRFCHFRNTDHGGLIETDHEVLLLILADLPDRFAFPNKTLPHLQHNSPSAPQRLSRSEISPSQILIQRDEALSDPYTK